MKESSNKAGIVLNRMYTGSYLSSNLGHEVINMFQADDANGKDPRHYLYLNSKGNFSSIGKEIETMLLVRHIGGNRVEVVGMARNLNPIESACCTLPRDLGKINQEVKSKQLELNITYAGVRIEDVFGYQGQQSIYASYWVKATDFYRPKAGMRIMIEFSPTNTQQAYAHINVQEDLSIITITLNANFASTSLHQYILDEQNLRPLNSICDDILSFWEPASKKIDLSSYGKERSISLFDICQIQKDENRFSNALSYFIQKSPELWQGFLEQLTGFSIGNILSVSREEDAKVVNDNYQLPTGGRIDLLLRTENSYIIVENKIDSSVIVQNGTSQLERYYNYVAYLKKEEEKRISLDIERIQKQLSEKRQRPEKWNDEIVVLAEKLTSLEEYRKQVLSRKIFGFVLAPDYNMPQDGLLRINTHHYNFVKLPYSTIYNWLADNAESELRNDINFKSFHDAMKRLKYEYENEALYEEMKEMFFARIKELQKVFKKSI